MDMLLGTLRGKTVYYDGSLFDKYTAKGKIRETLFFGVPDPEGRPGCYPARSAERKAQRIYLILKNEVCDIFDEETLALALTIVEDIVEGTWYDIYSKYPYKKLSEVVPSVIEKLKKYSEPESLSPIYLQLAELIMTRLAEINV